ncbi:MAG: MFS transporter [Bacteroidota bacterium]
MTNSPAIKTKKPKLSFWDIWNMSFGFLGIQFGFALQNANVSSIFQRLGAEMDEISLLWIAAPVTGLIVQPIIGYFSDRTWNSLGRRRPYFLFGAIFASIALFLMPNSPVLWMAAGMLWILDASINVSMEPFRAFVGDNLSSEQRTMGFAMQSFFIGTGAVIASALPFILTNWFGVNNVAPEGEIPDSVTWSFYLGGIIFFLAVLWTVMKSKEYSPEELASFEDHESEEFQTEEMTPEAFQIHRSKQLKTGLIMSIVGGLIIALLVIQNLDKELYILAIGLAIVGVLFLLAAMFQSDGRKDGAFTTIMNDMLTMPRTMVQLAVVQFFSWFALFSMWIYSTPAVAGHVFGTTNVDSAEYSAGAEWVGIMFAVYNGVAAIVAFGLPILAKQTSRKTTHTICLVLGGLGLISIFFINDQYLLMASMVGVGIAWASILSMPYAILTGSLPADKMGYYMGIFNFFIVIPQMVAATILGFMVRNFFGNEPIFAIITGGIAMILAGVLMVIVEDKDDVVLQS